MKKLMSSWLAMLLAAVLCAGFVSCKDDDDDKQDGTPEGLIDSDKESGMSVSLIGTWKCSYSGGYELLTFRSDGTGVYFDYDEDYGSDRETFTWMQNNGKLILIFGGEKETYTIVSVTSTKLTLMFDDEDEEIEVWIKQE